MIMPNLIRTVVISALHVCIVSISNLQKLCLIKSFPWLSVVTLELSSTAGHKQRFAWHLFTDSARHIWHNHTLSHINLVSHRPLAHQQRWPTLRQRAPTTLMNHTTFEWQHCCSSATHRGSLHDGLLCGLWWRIIKLAFIYRYKTSPCVALAAR